MNTTSDSLSIYDNDERVVCVYACARVCDEDWTQVHMQALSLRVDYDY